MPKALGNPNNLNLHRARETRIAPSNGDFDTETVNNDVDTDRIDREAVTDSKVVEVMQAENLNDQIDEY